MKKQPKQPKGKQKPVQTVRNRTVARQQAKKGNAPAVAAKAPMPTRQKLLLSLCALALLLAICFSTLFILSGRVNGPIVSKYPTPYDNIGLSGYIAASPSAYRDAALYTSLSTQKYADYTDAEWDSYVEDLLYSNRKLIAADQRHTAIGEGDVVEFFILDCTQNGAPAAVGAFAAYNYSNIFTVTVGNNTFGSSFDEAITGLVPNATLRETATSGALDENSVIAITYKMYADVKKDGATETVWATTPYSSATQARVALSNLDDTFRQALLTAYAAKQAVGEEFEFVLSAYYDDDKKADTPNVDVKVAATVDFIVTQERAIEITFTPDSGVQSSGGCFYYSGDNSYNQLVSGLYNKKGTYRIIIDTVDDYEMPTFNAAFIKDTLGFETDKTDEAEVRADFRAYCNEQKKKNYENSLLNSLYQQIVTNCKSLILDVPQEAWNEAYTSAQTELSYLYSVYASDYGVSDMDTFVLYYCYYNYGRQDITSAASYYSYYATEICQQELVMYLIYRNEGLKVTDMLLQQKYDEYLDSLVKRAGDEEKYNKEFFVSNLGEAKLYTIARKNAVRSLTDEYLMNNYVKYAGNATQD